MKLQTFTLSRAIVIGQCTLLVGCSVDAYDEYELATLEQEIVFGTDDRSDPYASSLQTKYLAESVVGLVHKNGLSYNSSAQTYTLSTSDFTALSSTQPLCSWEKYYGEKKGVNCSGSLVAPDVIATAEHCQAIPNWSLSDIRFVFHWRMDGAGSPRTTIPESDVYTASATIASSNYPNGEDWILYRLNRPVNNHRVAPMRQSGSTPISRPLAVIGHPQGLTQKYASGGVVTNNTASNGFLCNLDLYPGNSGSGVMSMDPNSIGMLEGIYTNGGQADFVQTFPTGCWISNTVSMSSTPAVFANKVTNFAFANVWNGSVAPGSSTFFANVNGDSANKADLIAVKWDGIHVRRSSSTSFGSDYFTAGAYYGDQGNFFADVTGDGKVDAIVSAGQIYVKTGTGSSFNAAVQWHSGLYGRYGTFFADMDGDGKSDAITVDKSSTRVRLSTGSTFQTVNAQVDNQKGPGDRGAYFADVDNDGRSDLIRVNNDGVWVMASDGLSYPSYRSWKNWTSNAYYGDIGTYFADVTGDGRADAIVSNPYGITVRRAKTDQTFGSNETWTSGVYLGQQGTYFADVTGDGLADAIVVNDNQVVVRRSTGSVFSSNENWAGANEYGTIGYFPHSQR